MTMMSRNIIQRLTGVPAALLVGFLLLSSVAAHAQMKGLRTGKLPNGLTYYIYNDGSATGEAQYYLYQNVGAILETDEELGWRTCWNIWHSTPPITSLMV